MRRETFIIYHPQAVFIHNHRRWFGLPSCVTHSIKVVIEWPDNHPVLRLWNDDENTITETTVEALKYEMSNLKSETHARAKNPQR